MIDRVQNGDTGLNKAGSVVADDPAPGIVSVIDLPSATEHPSLTVHPEASTHPGRP